MPSSPKGRSGSSEPGRTLREELFDYQNELGVSCGFIAGMKKTRFNSADFGAIVLSSYAVQP